MPATPAPSALNWYCVSVPFGICFRVLLPLQPRSVMDLQVQRGTKDAAVLG